MSDEIEFRWAMSLLERLREFRRLHRFHPSAIVDEYRLFLSEIAKREHKISPRVLAELADLADYARMFCVTRGDDEKR